MPTFKLTLAYDGTDYVGWQVQPNGPTIQSEVQSALALIVGREVKIVGSGRTDSGVHAAGQVASFCVPDWPHGASMFVRALNAKLPDSIAALDCEIVSDGFHAIADVVSKRYRYQLQIGGPPDPMAARDRWRLRGREVGDGVLDVEKMRAAAERIVGRQDFSSFEAAGAPRTSSIRHVTECRVVDQVDPSGRRRWIAVEVAANGFLYNMVRNIVGTLVEVGRGRRPVEWVDQVIAARDRSVAGATAPPHGLTMVSVKYGGG